MIKEIEDKEKILTLKNSLDEFLVFLDNDDCKNTDCDGCIHDRLCRNIYRLKTTLRARDLRGVEEDSNKEDDVFFKFELDRLDLFHLAAILSAVVYKQERVFEEFGDGADRLMRKLYSQIHKGKV